jgi:hypothetical protein
VLVGLACGLSTPPINVTLSESDVNRILQEAADVAVGSDAPIEITSVDIQEGLIRVYGTYTWQGITVDGSADMVLTVEDGNLYAEITSVNAQGINIEGDLIERANEELTRRFTEAASQNERVTFTSVTIGGDEVTLSFRVNLD